MINLLIEDIRKKKEFDDLSDSYVKRYLKLYLEENKKTKQKIEEITDYNKFTRSATHKKIVKEVRALLRKRYGLYKKESHSKIKKEIESMKEISLSRSKKILSMHLSTKERLSIYPLLYEKIWKVTGKPKSILDLGCGLNPLSFPYMDLEKINYSAVELSKKDCELLDLYFNSTNKIQGKTYNLDLLDLSKYKFLKYDICFIWKTLDVLEQDEKDISLKILKKIDAKFFILSFARKSIGGKKTISSWKWVERKIPNIVEKIEFENELFFVVKK